MKHKIVDASFDVHGTRSVQKLIQMCQDQPDMLKDIMDALRGNIAALSSDSNGNHVIQRCLSHKLEEYKVDVYEEVVTGLRSDEAEAFLIVEPRNCTGLAIGHLTSPRTKF